MCHAKEKRHKAYNNHFWTYVPLKPERQIQMTLHRTLRHLGLLRNFFSRQPFYISKDENFTTLRWQVLQ